MLSGNFQLWERKRRESKGNEKWKRIFCLSAIAHPLPFFSPLHPKSYQTSTEAQLSKPVSVWPLNSECIYFPCHLTIIYYLVSCFVWLVNFLHSISFSMCHFHNIVRPKSYFFAPSTFTRMRPSCGRRLINIFD